MSDALAESVAIPSTNSFFDMCHQVGVSTCLKVPAFVRRAVSCDGFIELEATHANFEYCAETFGVTSPAIPTSVGAHDVILLDLANSNADAKSEMCPDR